MNGYGKKTLLVIIEITLSIVVPVLVCWLFQSSFAEFYETGFLTGLGLYLVASPR
jgi:hypothetical protein